MLAVELDTGTATSYTNEDRDRIYRFFIERKILLRPLGNIIYILPPYCISSEELDTVYNAIEELIKTL